MDDSLIRSEGSDYAVSFCLLIQLQLLMLSLYRLSQVETMCGREGEKEREGGREREREGWVICA